MSSPAPPPPDPRVLQSNERTLLAWIRTGMGVMAFGFIVARSSQWFGAGADTPRMISPWIGVALVAIGTAFTAFAGLAYTRFRRSYLAGKPILPDKSLAVVLSLLLTVVGLALVMMLMIKAG